MALKDTEWAYALDMEASPKAVLLALAYCRNGKTGRCFPSQQEIQSMTGLSIATVKRSLGALDQDGIISRKKTAKGRYRSNDEYTLNHDFDSEKAELTMRPAHHEPRSQSHEAELTVSQTAAHGERAVEPTGKEPESNPKVAARGHRIPDDFAVTTEMVAWAKEKAPLVDGARATENFVDHWHAASGSTATKRDWTAAWRVWLRRDQERLERSPNRSTTPAQRMRDTLSLVPELQLKEIS